MKKNKILAFIQDKLSGTKVSTILEFNNVVAAGISFKNFLQEEEKKGINPGCYNLVEVGQYDEINDKLIVTGTLLYRGKDIDEQINDYLSQLED